MRCPEFEFEPRSAEGRAVVSILDRPGVWIRAGMSAVLVGLDLRQAMISLPYRCDRVIARELLEVAEAAFVSAAIAREAREKENPDGK